MAKRLIFLLGLNKRSCGKVMFLHLSVILFTGGSLFRGFSVQGGLCPGVSLSRGVSVQWVSVQGWQGVSVQGWQGGGGGRCSVQEGSLSWRSPGMMEERTVRILLECILVSKMFIHKIKVLFLEFHFKYTFYKRIE